MSLIANSSPLMLTHAVVIHQTITRLDSNNLALWQNAGLLIDEEGFVIASDKSNCDFMEESEIIETC